MTPRVEVYGENMRVAHIETVEFAVSRNDCVNKSSIHGRDDSCEA